MWLLKGMECKREESRRTPGFGVSRDADKACRKRTEK